MFIKPLNFKELKISNGNCSCETISSQNNDCLIFGWFCAKNKEIQKVEASSKSAEITNTTTVIPTTTRARSRQFTIRGDDSYGDKLLRKLDNRTNHRMLFKKMENFELEL